MRNLVTHHDVANDARMTRAELKMRLRRPITCLIVEGDTDIQVFSNLSDRDNSYVVVAHGRDNVIRALEILEKEQFPGVLAIVDADFEVLEENTSPSVNLLLTDTHDLETLLLKSPALEKVLTGFVEAKQIRFIRELSEEVREVLLTMGKPLGYMRWLSLRENLSLDFGQLELHDFRVFVDIQAFSTKVPELIKAVIKYSQQIALSDSELRERLYALMNNAHDPWQVCCGHDLICILVIVLPKLLLGKFGKHQIDITKINSAVDGPRQFEAVLRLAYEFSFFQETQLYRAIKLWEETNAPFVVLSKGDA